MGLITRRDFLNGAAIGVGAGLFTSRGVLAQDEPASGLLSDPAGPAPLRPGAYYPPTVTGLRGSHEGSFEVAHALAWNGQKPSEYEALDENYDLVIVGGGISGLASAYLYRQQAGLDKRVLILENHDDFGGHAKRNEFQLGGRTLLGVGGSVNLEHDSFSDTVHRVLEEIGVDIEKLDASREPGYLLSELGADSGYFLNARVYGANRIVRGNWMSAWLGGKECEALVSALGLPVEQQQRLLALARGDTDLVDELSPLETMSYIESTSYQAFLSSRAGLAPPTITLFDPFMEIFYGCGPDSVSVAGALLLGYPGINSLGLTGKLAGTFYGYLASRSTFPLFPDGNASVARLLVRKLIPEVASGNTMEDIVGARFDYSQLDRVDANVRLRLNSTAVNARNVDEGVEVSYVEGGNAYTVRGRHCILACYNDMVPHLCPELPAAQKEHLAYGEKIPLVMTNVALRNGAAVNASGPAQYHCPGSFFAVVTRAPPVSMGGYNGSSSGNEPLVLWMAHGPAPGNDGSQTTRDLYRLGRHRVYSTTFAAYENEVKNQLAAMFGANGFDAERDIAAITVNRWPHGYSYEYSQLYDPKFEEGEAPHELGRKPMGRISIANCDSEASAYLHAAIDAAARAVGELG